MKKFLFLFAILSSSAFCFEKGAELFESKQYLKCAQTFLTETRENDVRVPFYIRFLSENALIDPQDLGERLEQKWHERLQNVAFAPLAIGKGGTYLQISCLAQGLPNVAVYQEAERILGEIKAISSEQQIGYGYYVVGRFLEKKPTINRMLANQIVSAYEKGAEHAHGLSILSLAGLPQKYPKLLSKSKIHKTYIQECKVLTTHGKTIGIGERTLSQSCQDLRKKYWQLEGARQGHCGLQGTCSANSIPIQTEMGIAIQPDEADRWLYFAALGGDSFSQAMVGGHFYHGNNNLFPGNKLQALSFFEAAILGFTQSQMLKSNDLFKHCLMIAGSLLDKGEYVPQNDEKAFKYFKIAADKFNDPDATFNTGSMLDHGRGVVQDEAATRVYFEKASKLEHDEAMRLVGHRMFEGSHGYEKDSNKALTYLSAAASQNNPKALNALYNIYGRHWETAGVAVEAEDYPIPQDNVKALSYLKQSAELGNDEAQSCWISKVIDQRKDLPEDEAKLLVQCLERQYLHSPLIKGWFGAILTEGYRDIIACDGERALKLLREAKKEGVDYAFYILGIIYERGDCGVEQNYDKARKYYERSPHRAPAVATLGYFYELGYGALVKDGDKAIEYYQKALEMGNGVAANNLGALYQNGKFVKQDNARAFYYYKLGYDFGDPDASYQYALYLLQGLCCEKNVEEARGILTKLAPSSPNAAFALAAIQSQDNLSGSFLTFQKLAEEGLPRAQYVYGLQLYQINLEVKGSNQDMLKEAERFIRLASQNGCHYASSALRLLIGRSRIEPEEARLIVKKLLKGDIEGARSIRQNYAAGKVDEEEQEQQHVAASIRATTEALAQRDPEVARRRQEQYLAHFMDPLNKKNVSVKGLYKIATSQISQEGGSIAPTRGSGIKIKAGDSTLGFHNMHRSGQSSSATLDPGRINSFRQFAGNITQ
jgi:TPR repeat protein